MSQQKTTGLSEIIRQSATLKDLLDANQAAEILDVTAGTLAVWRCSGRYALPFVKVGRSVRYRRADLEAWLAKRTQSNGATR